MSVPPVQEVYTPKRMTDSGVLFTGNGVISHFVCTTSGTMGIEAGTDGNGATVVSDFSVTAGQVYFFAFEMPSGCYINISGGAVGTFGYRD